MTTLPFIETETSLALHNELEKAVFLAKEAGKITTKIRKKNYKIRNKGDDDVNPVTEADEAASEFIMSHLADFFPNDLVVSEEAPPLEKPLDDKRTWIIDPIDGTKEFIKGITEWSVMIGLEKDGRPVLGVVYQPDLDDLYYAVKTGGAFYAAGKEKPNQIRIRHLERDENAILIQSRSHWSQQAIDIAQKFNITNTLKHGSIGLKLGLIGRGIADLYLNFSHRCHLWDVCGPEIILNEAGGQIVTQNGQPINYHTKNTLVDQAFAAAGFKLGKKVQPHLLG